MNKTRERDTVHLFILRHIYHTEDSTILFIYVLPLAKETDDTARNKEKSTKALLETSRFGITTEESKQKK